MSPSLTTLDPESNKQQQKIIAFVYQIPKIADAILCRDRVTGTIFGIAFRSRKENDLLAFVPVVDMKMNQTTTRVRVLRVVRQGYQLSNFDDINLQVLSKKFEDFDLPTDFDLNDPDWEKIQK